MLASFAGEQGIKAAEISGIGAFQRAVIGFLDLETQEYDRIPVDEDTEVLSILGNLSIVDDEPRVHAHVTLSKSDASAVGGHLFEGICGATLEIFIRQEPGEFRRVTDDAVGIPLIDL